MRYFVKFFPEIAIKSKAVRKQLISTLRKNIRIALKEIDSTVDVLSKWDHLEVISEQNDNITQYRIEKRLREIPGIDSFFYAKVYPYTDFESIYQAVKDCYKDIIDGKTFASRTKRTGNVPIKSMDLDRYIGKRILEDFHACKVNLTKPELTVRIELRIDTCYILGQRVWGVSGSPVGSQEKVLSLISGGFDSAVASFKMMKKGCKVDYLFFNLGGYAHEIGVKEVAKYISKTYSTGYKARFISVNFEELIKELLLKVHHRYRGLILKRMMLRVSERLINEYGYYASVTGESIGQVSSQTLVNLNVISNVSTQLILRPLLTMDKNEIINIAKDIGTEDFAKNMPEYCAVVSEKPATAAKLEDVIKEEANIDFLVVEKAIENRFELNIRDFEVDSSLSGQIEITSFVQKDDIIIDIRDDEKREKNPEILKHYKYIQIPFYSLYTKFSGLDQQKNYLLYCDKGTTSKLMAINLKELGHENIKVFRLPETACAIN